MTAVINIAKDFSRTPSGRFLADGPDNGEAFRERLLKSALERGSVDVVLDSTAGLPSSFLEEAFGGLVRKGYFTAQELHARMNVIATTEHKRYVPIIWRHIDSARVRAPGMA